MIRSLAAFALVAAPSLASAQDCADFGLTSRYLTGFYCDEFRSLAGDAERTRSMNSTPGAETPLPEGEIWGEIDIIREAWRADPKKTLALIARIRNAGGLVEKQ